MWLCSRVVGSDSTLNTRVELYSKNIFLEFNNIKQFYISQIFTLTVLHQDTLSRMWMVVDMTSSFVMLYLFDSLDRIYQTPAVSINEQCLSLFFCSNNKQQRPIILTVERFEGVCYFLWRVVQPQVPNVQLLVVCTRSILLALQRWQQHAAAVPSSHPCSTAFLFFYTNQRTMSNIYFCFSYFFFYWSIKNKSHTVMTSHIGTQK